MNQFLSNKIIASIVALALLVGVGVLVSSGDTSSTTRNAALVVVTPCTKPGQVTKVSKQSVVCAALSPKNIWYPVFQEKKWICAKLGITRKQNGIFSVCGNNKLSKKRWFLTKPLMANSNPGLPTTDQDAFIKLTSNPELIVETSPTTPLAPASVTEITIAPTTETTLSATTETTLAATTTPTTPPAATTSAIPLTCAAGGTCEVGDIGPGGGIVFYVAPTSFTCGVDLKATCTYLEAAITTTSTWTPDTTAQWGCYGTSVPGTSFEIGTGRANTKIIIEAKNSNGQICSTSTTAASIAKAYNGGGKDDWFLPSRKELNALCLEFFNDPNSKYAGNDLWTGYQKDGCIGRQSAVTSATNVTPGWSFAADYYWSSSEGGAYGAWFQYFDNGGQGSNSKFYTYYVRPVRAF